MHHWTPPSNLIFSDALKIQQATSTWTGCGFSKTDLLIQPIADGYFTKNGIFFLKSIPVMLMEKKFLKQHYVIKNIKWITWESSAFGFYF